MTSNIVVTNEVAIADAARRAHLALEAAIAEPNACRHRVDLTNALNYIESILRQGENA